MSKNRFSIVLYLLTYRHILSRSRFIILVSRTPLLTWKLKYKKYIRVF